MDSCESCKYWGTGDDDDNKLNGSLKPCTKVRMFYDCTDWNDDVESENYCNRELMDKYKDHKAFVQDGSDYKATLYVMSDFGCVQYEGGKTKSFGEGINVDDIDLGVNRFIDRGE